MRFLLFNLVVGAAVVYLISGNAGDAVRNAGFSETTASVIEDIGKKARATVAKAVEKAPNPSPVPTKAPSPKSDSKASQKTNSVAKSSAPPIAAPPTKTAKTVASRPVHKAPPPKANPTDEASKGKLAAVSPEVGKRRAEILGKKSPEAKYAIEGGEQLMSASDRYRELSKLVDDMELVYFNSLGN